MAQICDQSTYWLSFPRANCRPHPVEHFSRQSVDGPGAHESHQPDRVDDPGREASAEWLKSATNRRTGYPSLAQIAGHTLSSIFLDSLWMDLERMNRINQTVSMIPEERRQQNGSNLRPIDVLVILPSRKLPATPCRAFFSTVCGWTWSA